MIYGPYRSHASSMNSHVVLQREEAWDETGKPPKRAAHHHAGGGKRSCPRYFVRALERALKAWLGKR